MTTTYEPRQTRRWSTRELDTLIGKTISAQIGGAEHTGTVTEAGIGRFGCPFLAFADGTGVDWHRDTDEATITVHDGSVR